MAVYTLDVVLDGMISSIIRAKISALRNESAIFYLTLTAPFAKLPLSMQNINIQGRLYHDRANT